MPTCSAATGTKAKLALVPKGGTFIDTVPAHLGRRHQIPFLSEDIARDFDKIANELLTGQVFAGHSIRTGQTIEGSFECYLDYERLMALLALVFGIAADPVIQAAEGLTAPTSAASAALAGSGVGNVDDGKHYYVVTFYDGTGETEYGPWVALTVADKSVDGQVDLSNIPLGPAGTTGRRIYRSKVGEFEHYRLTEISDNTTTTYTDNIADASLGSEQPPMANGTGLRALHVLDLDDELCDIFSTVGVDRVADQVAGGGNESVFCFAAVKHNGFIVNMEQGAPLKVQFPLLLRDLSYVAATDWANYRDANLVDLVCLPSDLAFRINAQSGAALASGDAIARPATMQITYDGQLAGEKVQDDQIDEPIRSGRPTVKVQLGFSTMTDALAQLFQVWDAADTVLKMDIIATGKALGAGNYAWTMLFPSLSIEKITTRVAGSDRIPYSVELHAAPVGAGVTVAGMTGFTAPLRWQFYNGVGYNPLDVGMPTS